MEEVNFPSRFEELRQGDGGNFVVDNFWDVSSVSAADIADKIEEFIDLANSASDILSIKQDNIDNLYSLIQGFADLNEQNRCAFLEALVELGSSAFQKISNELEPEAKNSIKIVLYFMFAMMNKFDSNANAKASAINMDDDDDKPARKTTKGGKAGKGGKTSNKASAASTLTETFIQMINLTIAFLDSGSTSCIWNMGIMNENFVSIIWQPALQHIVSRPSNMSASDKQIKALCMTIIVSSVRYFGNANTSGSFFALSAGLLEAVITHEHSISIVADICAKCFIFAEIIPSEVFKDIGNMNMTAMSAIGVRNIGTFLEAVAKANASIITKYFPVLLKQLDCPQHQIRSSLLAVMGNVVHYIHDCCLTQAGKNYETDEKNTSKNADDGEDKDEANDEERDDDDEAEDDDNIKMKDKNGKVNIAQLIRTRDSFLDILMERCHDVNHFTRANVLKVWSFLAESNAIPVSRIGFAAEAAADRIDDKTAIVRKQALNLLTAIMDNNPFSSDLNIDKFQKRKTDLEASFRIRVEDIMHMVHENSPEDEEDEVALTEEEQFEQDCKHIDVLQDSDIMALKKNMEYINCSLELVKCLTASSQKCLLLLKSKVNSDVVESIRFIKRAVNFQLKASFSHLKATFILIWHQDTSIQNEVLSAFKDVFLTDGSAPSEDTTAEDGQRVAAAAASSLPAKEVATNLVELTSSCHESSELSSLEKIVSDLFTSNAMESSVANYLWETIQTFHDQFYSGALGKNTTRLGHVLMVLSMIYKDVKNDDMPLSRFQLLTRTGFHSVVFENQDYLTLKYTCICIQRTPSYMSLFCTDRVKNADRCQSLEDCANGIRDIIIGRNCGNEMKVTKRWIGACEEACFALFHCHPAPDRVCASAVTTLFHAISNNGSGTFNVSAAKLSRFVYVLGQFAMNTLLFTEKLAQFAKQGMSSANKKSSTMVAETKSSEEMSLEEEMGMSAAVDAENDKTFNQIVETQIVSQNILGEFQGFLAYIIMNPHKGFGDHFLRETAVFSLCKFMAISNALCDKFLPLLFTVLERETSNSIRTTIVMALGDLSFRFPNSVEPWTEKIYARLSDDSLVVRHNSLQVLTHLVLNDYLKVKGHIVEVVLCLTDAEESIRDIANIFFQKLSERSNNPIYNLLSDIISNLSTQTETTAEASNTFEKENSTSNSKLRVLTEKQFQETMVFLLSFIKKDKLADGLMERLMTRISLSTSLKQRRNLSFCVGELNITEKGVKKMVELVKVIKDALYDEKVFDNIKNCVIKAKKSIRFGAGSATSATSAGGAANVEEMQATQMTQGGGGADGSSGVATGGSSANKELKANIAELEQILEKIRSNSTGNNDGSDSSALETADSDMAVEQQDNSDANMYEGADENSQVCNNNFNSNNNNNNNNNKGAKAKPTPKKAGKKPSKKTNSGSGKASSKKKAAYSSDESEGEDDDEDEEDEDEEEEMVSAKGKGGKTNAKANSQNNKANNENARQQQNQRRRGVKVTDDDDF